MTDREVKEFRRDVHYAALPNRIGMGVLKLYLVLGALMILGFVLALVVDNVEGH